MRALERISWNFVIDFAPRLAVLFTSIWVARHVSVESFGVYMTAQSLAVSLWTPMDLIANPAYTVRSVCQASSPVRRASQLFRTRVIAGATLAAMFLALALLATDHNRKLLISISGIYVLSYSFYGDWFCRAFQRIRLLAYLNLALSLGLFLGTSALLQRRSEIDGPLILWSVLYGVSGVISLLMLRRSGTNLVGPPSFYPVLQSLKEAAPFSLVGILTSLMAQAPILIIGTLLGASQVAHFAAAYRLVLAPAALAIVIGWSFYPKLLSSLNRPEFDDAVNRFIVTAVGIGLACAVIVTATAPIIIRQFYGDSYLDAVPLLRALIWIAPLQFTATAYEFVLVAIGAEAARFRAYAITSTVGTIGLILLTYFSGVVGATVAQIAFYVAVLITVRSILVRRNRETRAKFLAEVIPQA